MVDTYALAKAIYNVQSYEGKVVKFTGPLDFFKVCRGFHVKKY